jgi:[ribosomal protein S5]-alanine N-acetyltransferase
MTFALLGLEYDHMKTDSNAIHPATLQTPRLTLKAITPAVVHQLASSMTKPELLDYFGFDEARYAHFMIMHQKGMETHSLSHYYFLMIETETGAPIGEVGFHTWNAKHRRADLFYLIHSDENKQKRYMTEALKAVIDFGFTDLSLHRIAALVAKWNTPSVKLIQNNGFTFEGTMRQDYNVDGVNSDSDCYSLLKPEWELLRRQ